MAAAPLGKAANAPAASMPPAAPPAMAPTMGVTKRIKAGIANKAIIISISPVSTASKPVPSSAKTSVPTSWKAAA